MISTRDKIYDIAVSHSADEVDVLLNKGEDLTLLGDINQDGIVDLLDVAPFVTLLTSGAFQSEADVNEDGVVSLLDVNPFVELLGG